MRRRRPASCWPARSDRSTCCWDCCGAPAPTKKALELALREAIAHRDNWIGCEHIVLGILRGGDDVAATLLTEHVEGRRLRAEVIALLDEAA